MTNRDRNPVVRGEPSRYPEDVEIVSFDPRTADGARRDEWVALQHAVWRVDFPGDPQVPAAFWLTAATTDLEGNPARSWLAREGATVLGGVTVALPTLDNTHAALLDLAVTPDHRRRGLGRALLDHARSEARSAGRSLLIGACGGRSPGPAFAAAVGAQRGLVEVRRVLDLPVPPERVAGWVEEAAKHAAGYSVVRWQGPVPAVDREDMLTLHDHLSDAPFDDLDYRPQRWTPDRLDRFEQTLGDAGLRTYSVAARHDDSGRLAAYTDVWVHAGQPSWAWQGDTVVLPEHRGHRLGMLVKASMLDWLADVEPQVRRLDTENAGSNTPMVAINEALGFRVIGSFEEWQLRLSPP